MADLTCFGAFLGIISLLCFINSVIGPAYVAVKFNDSCGYFGSYGPMTALQFSIDNLLGDDDGDGCPFPESIVTDITEYDWEFWDFDSEQFTGQYVMWAFGALAALFTLIATCLFFGMACRTEGLSVPKQKVTSVLSFLSAVSGAVVILIWNFVAVPDLEDTLRNDIIDVDLQFNEQCFSQIALIGGIVFSLGNACIAACAVQRGFDFDI